MLTNRWQRQLTDGELSILMAPKFVSWFVNSGRLTEATSECAP